MHIQLKALSKTYAESGQPQSVLQQVTQTLPAGQFTLLLGKSGSGKSTLLNLLSGIDTPDAGEVWLGDTCLNRLQEPALTHFRRQHIGIVFQFFHLLPTLTVRENVQLPAELAGVKQVAGRSLQQQALELLAAVGLADRADSRPERLSGGQQQRVAIARALMMSPPLILADEPTGNLDEQSGQEVMALLLQLTREAGKSLVMATHDREWVSLADQVFQIHQGQMEPWTP